MTGKNTSTGSFLTGVRVLELADELGEYCGKILAGLGADVIKVEPPGGEKTRGYGPFYENTPGPNRSLYFWHYNFGKRSITLDLATEAGRAHFLELAESADIVIDTRPRDYLAAGGIGFSQLKAVNPGIVYVRISPFGDDGPWADYKGSDLVHLALGGVMMNCGYDPKPDGEYETPPIAPQMWQAYHITGETAVISILGALYYRLHSGVGQQLSASVHDAVAKNTETDIPDWIYRHSPHNRLTCRHSFPSSRSKGHDRPASPSIAMTKDGRWVLPYQTYLPGSGSSAEGLVALLKDRGLGDEIEDLNAAALLEPASGLNHTRALIARMLGSFTFDSDLWLDAQKRGLPWAPLRRPEENVGDPHWSQRETFFDVHYPELNKTFTQVGAKWFAPGLPWRRGPRAPLVGEHNTEILSNPSAWVARPRFVDTTQRVIAGVGVSKWGKPWALSGVRVVDLGWILASAGGGRFLAALGAEVIKVEHSTKIDGMRRGGCAAPDGLRDERDAATAPLRSSATTSLNRSGSFMEINTGKRAISLNLKSEKGRKVLKNLLEQADILVEGYSPGTLDRMGFGYDVLREINPRLIYVQQSGMGQAGVYGRLKSFGPTAQALSGISEMSGLSEPYPPAGIGYSYLDWFGAYQIAIAMLAGLYRREVSGEGCWIDSAQVEAGIYLTGTSVLHHSANGESWARYGNRSPYKPAAPHGAYRVRGSDRWIALGAFDQAEWLALVRVLDVPEWANDSRFLSLDLRIANHSALDALVDQKTQTWDGIKLMEALQAAAVPAGICETAEDRCEWDPQLKHLEWLMEFAQTEIGRWRSKTPPTKFSETPPYQGGVVDRHGPNYGEDNHYVYSTLLGLSEDEIQALVDEGVL